MWLVYHRAEGGGPSASEGCALAVAGALRFESPLLFRELLVFVIVSLLFVQSTTVRLGEGGGCPDPDGGGGCYTATGGYYDYNACIKLGFEIYGPHYFVLY